MGGKKEWIRPMLTVITREKDRQVEVLLICKFIRDPSLSGPSAYHMSCWAGPISAPPYGEHCNINAIS